MGSLPRSAQWVVCHARRNSLKGSRRGASRRDFPIVAQPAASQDEPVDPMANVNTAALEEEAREKAAAEKAAAAAKEKKKPAPPPLTPIFVEGDDEIMYVDAVNGVVETSGGKALVLDRGDTLASVLKGRDIPIPIHYRCSPTTGCTFSGTGFGVHHARLRQIGRR